MRSCFATLVFLLLLFGCNPAESEDAADADDWTFAEDGLQLQEDLLIAESDDFFFGRIVDMDIDGEGRMYVADREAHHIKVLSPEGELLQTIGREGEGPGEFSGLSSMVVSRGDSVFAYEVGRITAFGPAPAYDLAYITSVDRDGAAPVGPLLVPSDDGFFLPYTSIANRTAEEDRITALRPLAYDGVPGDTLYAGRPQPFVTDNSGEIPISTRLPFGRRSFYAMGPGDRLYHASTDSLGITSVSRSGEHASVFHVPLDPVPVTRADREEIPESMPDGLRRALLEALPDTKPAFERFLVDEQERFWFKRETDDPDRTAWWVVTPDARHIDTLALPNAADLYVVTRDYAYGETRDEQGAPALVRYRLAE